MKYLKEYNVVQPTTKSEKTYMIGNTREQKKKCKYIVAENWFKAKLNKLKREYGIKFDRQKRFGYRIFDFWIKDLGIAIEIDGGYHITRKQKDENYDKYFKDKFGVIVLRVRNFNEGDAYGAIEFIKKSDSIYLRKVEDRTFAIDNIDLQRVEKEKNIRDNFFNPEVQKEIFSNYWSKEKREISKPKKQCKLAKQLFLDSFVNPK